VSDSDGLDPKFYVEYFHSNRVNAVVRLNEKLYEDKAFNDNNMRLYNIEFPDCSTPTE
jgi:hypothetical protein